MAGVLSFTLGLEASNFLRGIGMASGGVISLAGAMQGIKTVIDGVWGAIERGGALYDLSNRTGESVKSLYQLQEAFKVTGLGADEVTPMLMRLQKSLGGVDEIGNKTEDVFQELGLDMKALIAADAPRQLELISKALGQVGRERGVFLAGRLFGREGAGNAMQLSRDAEGFRDAIKDALPAAEVFQRTAAAFDKIGDTLATIKAHMAGMFAGIAEGAAAGIQNVLDWINKIDWVGIGQKIGAVISAFGEAWKSGELGLLIELSLGAAFERVGNYALKIFVGVGAAIKASLADAILAAISGMAILGTGIKAAFQLSNEKAAASQYQDLAARETDPKRKAFALGLAADADARYTALKDKLATDLAVAMGMTGEATADTLKKSASAFKQGYGAAPDNVLGTQFSQDFATLVALLNDRVTSHLADKANPHPDPLGIASNSKGFQVSNLEKMGFIFNSGGPGIDHARSTAENTRQMLAELKVIKMNTGKNPQGDFFKRT